MAQEPTSACHPSSPAEEFFLLPREIALPFPPLLLTPPHTVPTCRQVPCSSCPSCLSSHLGCPTPDPAPPSLPVLAAGSLLLGFSVMLEARHPGLRTCRASRRTTAGLPGLGVLGEGAALRLSVEGTLSPKDFEGSPMDTSFVHSCPSPTFVLPLGTASACPCLLGSRAPTPIKSSQPTKSIEEDLLGARHYIHSALGDKRERDSVSSPEPHAHP